MSLFQRSKPNIVVMGHSYKHTFMSGLSELAFVLKDLKTTWHKWRAHEDHIYNANQGHLSPLEFNLLQYWKMYTLYPKSNYNLKHYEY